MSTGQVARRGVAAAAVPCLDSSRVNGQGLRGLRIGGLWTGDRYASISWLRAPSIAEFISGFGIGAS
eukprot:15072105-Alexandrium_andersonii.AAC.1